MNQQDQNNVQPQPPATSSVEESRRQELAAWLISRQARRTISYQPVRLG